MSRIDLTLNDEADTVRFAQRLAEILPTALVVALNGMLGAGKTRLVRAFAEACDVPADEITSPTFTLWQTYHGQRVIHHLDAYRIHDEDEFLQLGVEEAYDEESITFIEWADRVQGALPPENLALNIDVVSPAARRVSLWTGAKRLGSILKQLQQDFESS